MTYISKILPSKRTPCAAKKVQTAHVLSTNKHLGLSINSEAEFETAEEMYANITFKSQL